MENCAALSLSTAEELVENLPLFRGLSAQQQFLARSVLRRKQIPAGCELMSEAQAGEIIYLIAEGTVRISVMRGGQEVVIGLRGVGDILGEMSVIDGSKRSANVVTQSDCTLFWIERADFWEVLWPMPTFCLNLTSLMVKRIRTLSSHVESMATLSVAGRLAQLLSNLAADYGCADAFDDAPGAVEIPFRLTQGDLANMIAATRVQVNQVIHGWKKRGLIRIEHSRIHVLNEAGLRDCVV